MQKALIERAELRSWGHQSLVEAKLRITERRFRLGVGNSVPRRRIGELRDRLELLAPPLGDQLAQLRRVIGKELKRRGGAEFLAHEEQWGIRQKEQQGRCGSEPGCVDLMIQPLAKGAIADLVVVLQGVDELPGRSIARRRAALFFEPTSRRPLAFVQPALLDAAGDF